MTAYQHPIHVLPPGMVLASFLVAISLVLGLGYLVHDRGAPGVVTVNGAATESVVGLEGPPTGIVNGALVLRRQAGPPATRVEGDPATVVLLHGGHDPEPTPAPDQAHH